MRRQEDGMTLIEVALALAIISVALVPTANMWLASAQSTQAAERLARAQLLAQRMLESQVRDVAYSQQAATSGIDVTSGLSYDVTLSAQSYPSLSTPTLRRAVVTVRAADGTFLAQLTTLTAKEDNR